LATTEFAFNNEVYIVSKLSPFKVNCRREPMIAFEIRKKEKYVKAEEFVKKMKKMHEEIKAALKKLQEVIVNRNKELKKLIEKFIEPYKLYQRMQ